MTATPRFAVRVPPALLTQARTVAAERGETLSDVIRAALEHYVEEACQAS